VEVLSVTDPKVDEDTAAGVYMQAITFAKNEAYSKEVAFHTRKGCRANVQTRDAESGWCFKNGGQPLFGYRAERLHRGEVKKGRPLMKCIWVAQPQPPPTATRPSTGAYAPRGAPPTRVPRGDAAVQNVNRSDICIWRAGRALIGWPKRALTCFPSGVNCAVVSRELNCVWFQAL
jgi:hypothetical protein